MSRSPSNGRPQSRRRSGTAARALLVVVAVSALQTGTASYEGEERRERVEALDAIVTALGYEPTVVSITTHSLNTTPLRTVSWHDFVRLSRSTALTQTDGLFPGSNCIEDIACVPDYGDSETNAGPFCDNSSGWVVYKGAPPGSSIMEAVPGMGPMPSVCGGIWGPTVYWESVELSNTKDPAVKAGLLLENCYNTEWLIHPSSGCPGPGAFDTFLTHWRARGPGVLATFGFGGDVHMDIFLGNGAENAYDLPLHLAVFP